MIISDITMKKNNYIKFLTSFTPITWLTKSDSKKLLTFNSFKTINKLITKHKKVHYSFRSIVSKQFVHVIKLSQNVYKFKYSSK